MRIYWKLPANWREIVNAVHWAANDDLPIEISGPAHLVAHLTRQPQKQRTIVHLLNYQARSGQGIGNVPVTLRLPLGTAPRLVELLSPDFQSPKRIAVSPVSPQRWRFTVSSVDVYAIAAVTF